MKHPIRSDSEMEKFALLFEALTKGSAEGQIERQEAEGQDSFVNSDTLPTNLKAGAREALEKAGTEFLGKVESDPLFQYVRLPKGWEKVATDHSMWSDLVDEKGRKRAAIFYKAAFYDRDAFLTLTRRYDYRRDYAAISARTHVSSQVTDCDKAIFTTSHTPFPKDGNYFDIADEKDQKALEWLSKHFPNWRDPEAYWD